MKRPAFLLTSLVLPLSAQLRITEVMSDSGHSDSDASGDWFEVTNTGSSAVNVAGFSYDDEGATAGASGDFPSITLAAGESLIVLNEASATLFRDLWELDASVSIITNTQIDDFQGLGSGGDAVNLYDDNNGLIDTFTFGAATEGFSFARFEDGTPVSGGLSSAGLFGAYESNDSSEDVASPSIVVGQPEPLPPFFTGPDSTAALPNSSLATLSFRITSIDPNPGDSITLSASGTPPWLSLNNLGGGIASLSGTPPSSAIGPHDFEVTATDNTGLSASSTFTINILPPSSPIILNEYNAVAADEFLDGGEELDVDAESDPLLGRILGNGGPWVEFVVTQTVDLRGWNLNITGNSNTRSLTFSDHIALSAIPAGTILTLTQNQSTSPTAFNITSRFNTSGYAWSNIWMFDPILIDQANSTHPASPAIGSSNTLVTWTNATGDIVYGPSGESISLQDSDDNGTGDTLISVGSTELFRLELNPSSSVTPLSIDYDDGDNSTFGAPNIWSNGTMTQSFAAFVTPDNPPFFGSVDNTKSVRGEFQVSILSESTTQTIVEAPDFLSITQGNLIQISNNRPLTPADIGTHEITLSATNGSATNFIVFPLLVQHPSPPLILNEYNAVADDQFLNGGILQADLDGNPVSEDSHFGRILGNGGNWFELALVGDGSAGFTNLTNWSIEIGRINNSNLFVPTNTITLSDADTWSSIAHGTLLTFIDQNTNNGGLDTGINITDNLATEGYAWTNIHLGTPGTVSTTSGSNLSIDSSNSAFIIRDASGTIIFGPAGEGIAPLSGVSGTEIFELENDASPLVSSCDDASSTFLGYDDGSSGSTFGSPNLFSPLDSDVDQAQDFTPFILTPLDFFLADLGLSEEGFATDPDNDGFSTLDEYLLGGDPLNAAIFPTTNIDSNTGTISVTVRVDDPNFTLTPERSPDLVTWFTDQLEISDEPSPLGSSFVIRNFVFDGPDPRMFFRVTSER